MNAFKKGSFLKRQPASEEMGLQITSMADIFTIILVFLLKSYATSALNLTPSQGMVLPQADASQAPIEALKMEISQTAIQIEGQIVMPLENYKPVGSEVQGNGTLRTLSTALERERKRQLLIAQSNTDVKVDSKIVVVADQKVPYQTVKQALASAAVQGYTDFKLAVIKGE